ncbi:MAG: hypothetical protein V7636_2848, partial [Actinomycetota bacterium]
EPAVPAAQIKDPLPADIADVPRMIRVEPVDLRLVGVGLRNSVPSVEVPDAVVMHLVESCQAGI